MKNYKYSKFVIIILFILAFSCNQYDEKDQWKIIYKNDKKGNTLLGSKTSVINAIRTGANIKIGWGSKGKNHSIEHLSKPIWLAILDDKEVIAHLDPQVLSTIDWENLSANYADLSKLKEEWRVVLTTKGEFDAIWYDRKNDTIIKRIPQNHVITWFSTNKGKNVKPLYSE